MNKQKVSGNTFNLHPSQTFSLSVKPNDINELDIVSECTYSKIDKSTDNIPSKSFTESLIVNKMVHISDYTSKTYRIVMLKNNDGYNISCGLVNQNTKFVFDESRTDAIVPNNIVNNKWTINDNDLSELSLDPVLVVEEKKSESKSEETNSPSKSESFPEWFNAMRLVAANFPLKLYAIAYKINKKNTDEAVNWIFDKGHKYLKDHKDEFKESKDNNDKWACQFCTYLNGPERTLCEMCRHNKPERVPEYFNDFNHKFWKKDTHEVKETDNLKFGDMHYAGDEISFKKNHTLPKRPGKKRLVIYGRPKSLSPNANTKCARKAIRYVFGALLLHHGVISEAISCTEYLETYGILKVKKGHNPQLTQLSRIWDIALNLKNELSKQYDNKKLNKNNYQHLIKLGSNDELKTIINEKKPLIVKDVTSKTDDELRRELIKYKIRKIPKDKKELEKHVILHRLENTVNGKRCICGSKMIKMSAKEIYGNSLCCDICKKEVLGPIQVYHCPRERLKIHKSGYDVCNECVKRRWESNVIDLIDIDSDDLRVLDITKTDDSTDIDKSNKDPYEYISKIVVDKMTLLFQLYPGTRDFGSELTFNASTTVDFENLSNIGTPAKSLLRTVSEEAKKLDVSYINEPMTLSRNLTEVTTSLNSSRNDNHKINNNDSDSKLNCNGSLLPPSLNPITKLTRARSNPELTPDNKRSINTTPRSQRILSGTIVDNDGKIRLSRVPRDVESNEITQMIMYLVRKDIESSVIRDCLFARRLRSRKRIMGFRLFDSLFDNTQNNLLYQDFVWLLASAIKECKFETVHDASLDDSVINERIKKQMELRNMELKIGRENKTMIHVETIEFNSDCEVPHINIKNKDKKNKLLINKDNKAKKWKRDNWDNANENKTIHYNKGIEGSGTKLLRLTQKSFQGLYSKITDLFRKQLNKNLNMGALGFLQSWTLHFDVSDYEFLHDSQIFPVIRSLMTRSPIQSDNVKLGVTLEMKDDNEIKDDINDSDNETENKSDNNDDYVEINGNVNDMKLNDNEIAVYQPINLVSKSNIETSTAQHRANYINDETTETFWQSSLNANNDQFNYNRIRGTHWIKFKFDETIYVREIVWHIDAGRDSEYVPRNVQILVGNSNTDNELCADITVPNRYSGWYSFKCIDFDKKVKKYNVDENGGINLKWLQLKIPAIQNNQYELRIRQIAIYGNDTKLKNIKSDSYQKKLRRIQDNALNLFRKLVSRTFLPNALRQVQIEQSIEHRKETIKQIYGNENNDNNDSNNNSDDDDAKTPANSKIS